MSRSVELTTLCLWLQGKHDFQPYQHSAQTFTKTFREENILGSLRDYMTTEFLPVRLTTMDSVRSS